jgi:acetyltransferase-like isoleucine patch superfamily enzyme
MDRIRHLIARFFKQSKKPFMNTKRAYSRFEIGDYTYGWPTIISLGSNSKLMIGRFCSISEGVTILLGGEHRTEWITTYPFNSLFEGAQHYTGHPRSKGDVMVGNDVWIGRDAFILSGVTIGNGAVIGARSVVAKDVMPFSIVVGNPARHIRYRFSESMIEELQSIAWWDWSISKIEEAWPLLLSSELDAFIAKYGKKHNAPTNTQL